MAKQIRKQTTKKPLHHQVKTYNFFLVLAILMGMIAGVLMVRVFYLNQRNNQDLKSQTQTDCTTNESCTKKYVGMTESNATQEVQKQGRVFRIVERDGKSFPVTEDYNKERLNFSIKDGKVIKAELY